MASLAEKGFGVLKIRSKERANNDIYFKPHPDTLAEDNPILASANTSLDFYRAAFNDVSRISDSQAQLASRHHQHAELLETILTPEQEQSDNN